MIHWLHHVSIWMHAVQGAGWIGWAFLVCLYASLALVFIPGSILMLSAGAIYGFWAGMGLVLAGNASAAGASLLIARYFLRSLAKKYLAEHPAIEILAIAAEKDGWRIIALSHLSPIVPFSLVNYIFGVTTISIGEFLFATVLGTVPSGCVYVYLGSVVGNLAAARGEMSHHRPLEWLLQAIGLAATIGVTLYISRAAGKSLKRRLPKTK